MNDNASGSAAILALAEKIAASDVRTTSGSVSRSGAPRKSGSSVRPATSRSWPQAIRRARPHLGVPQLRHDRFGELHGRGVRREPFDVPRRGRGDPRGLRRAGEVYTDYFDGTDQPWIDSEYSGRSDYQAFIDNGIPSGGLFSGADDVKTAEQAAVFGGEAGVIMDRNYHTADDTLANVSRESIDIFAPAIGNAAAVLAWNAVEPPVEPSPEPSDPGVEPSPEPAMRRPRHRPRPPHPRGPRARAGTSRTRVPRSRARRCR